MEAPSGYSHFSFQFSFISPFFELYGFSLCLSGLICIFVCYDIDLLVITQDAVIELSEHGIVLIVEESGCLQAKVYLQREVLDFEFKILIS